LSEAESAAAGGALLLETSLRRGCDERVAQLRVLITHTSEELLEYKRNVHEGVHAFFYEMRAHTLATAMVRGHAPHDVIRKAFATIHSDNEVQECR
jgi:hypothetical protein